MYMLVLHLTYTGGHTDLEERVSVSRLESAAAENGGWLKQYNRSLKIAKGWDGISTCWTYLCRPRRVIDIFSSTKYEGHDTGVAKAKMPMCAFSLPFDHQLISRYSRWYLIFVSRNNGRGEV